MSAASVANAAPKVRLDAMTVHDPAEPMAGATTDAAGHLRDWTAEKHSWQEYEDKNNEIDLMFSVHKVE